MQEHTGKPNEGVAGENKELKLNPNLQDLVKEGPGELPIPEIKHVFEKEPIKIDFGNENNRGFFNGLSESARNLVGGLYEGTKMNTVDRAKIMFNTVLMDWHENRASKIAENRDGYQGELNSVEERIKRHEESLQKIETGLGAVPEDVRRKAEMERAGFDKQRDFVRGNLEKENSKLAMRERKKASYENTRKDIVEDVSGRIRERLNPLEGQLEKIKTQKEALDLEIGAFANKKDSFQKKIEEFEGEVEATEFGSVKSAYKKELDKLRESVAESEKHIKSRLGERRAIEREFADVDHKADKWRIKHNEFARLLDKKVVYREAEPVVVKEMDLKRREVVGELTSREKPAVVEAAKKERGQETIELSASEYVSQWNVYFGSEFRLDPRFIGMVEKSVGDRGISMDIIESFVQDYAVAVEKSGGRPLRKGKLLRNFKLLRTFLIYK